MEGLRRRFGQLEVEINIMTILELITFKRLDYESIGDALTRFETTRTRVEGNVQNFDMPQAALAWLLLEALRIPRPAWPLLFQPTGGQLPVTADQMTAMIAQIRQQAHITEHTHAGPRTLREGMQDRYFGGKGQSWFQESESFE